MSAQEGAVNRLALKGLVVRLLERLYLRHPPRGDKCRMDRVLVVDGVCLAVGELHRKTEGILVLVTNLPEPLEVPYAGDIS